MGPKLVNATNAIYQHMDLAPVMTRLMSLAQNNLVGLFPGSNPYGFQADPNTFCLFAVPKNGSTDPSNQLVSIWPRDHSSTFWSWSFNHHSIAASLSACRLPLHAYLCNRTDSLSAVSKDLYRD